jgi:hypothetical protein
MSNNLVKSLGPVIREQRLSYKDGNVCPRSCAASDLRDQDRSSASLEVLLIPGGCCP